MINFEHIIQVKAFARQDGALLALLWIASFACLIYIPALPLGNIFALATPLFVGWRLVKFRNYALDGAISLRRGFAYSTYTFFYASAIFAIAQYLYFKFLDNGVFLSMLTEAMKAVAPMYKESGATQDELKESMDMLTTLTPIQWTLMFMMQNLLMGLIASLPIAAVCARRGGKTTNINQRHNK